MKPFHVLFIMEVQGGSNFKFQHFAKLNLISLFSIQTQLGIHVREGLDEDNPIACGSDTAFAHSQHIVELNLH